MVLSISTCKQNLFKGKYLTYLNNINYDSIAKAIHVPYRHPQKKCRLRSLGGQQIKHQICLKL